MISEPGNPRDGVAEFSSDGEKISVTAEIKIAREGDFYYFFASL